MAAPQRTMVARLAGPVQSWGAEPSLRTATTHSTPTWSGLLGLCRAALGHGRSDPPEQIAWLRELTMAVRVDAPGSVHVDFHTINPLPAGYERFVGVQTRDRGLVPVGTTVQSSGQAPRWLNGQAPMVTRRHLIHDAAFLWLASGPADAVERLAAALAAPRWQLALGRASCTPASPVLLGTHPGGLLDAARRVPRAAPSPRRRPGRPAGMANQVDLVRLHEDTDGAEPGGPGEGPARVRVVLDVPLGSHPQNGYAAGRHRVQRLPAPHDADLLSWAFSHLSHPARPAGDQQTRKGSDD
jgi:CRISPR system Cascade subunit CasD